MFEYLFKFDNSDLFKEKWNHFLCQQPASIKYTELYLEYSLALSESVEDYSFVMLLNEEVVGIAFLPIETLQSGAKWISLSGNYIIAPLASNPKATGAIFKKIDFIAKKHLVKKIMFDVDPLVSNNGDNVNQLLKYGYIDTSCTNYLIDLGVTKKEFWENLGTSHRKTIKKFKAKETYGIQLYTGESSERKIFDLYQNAHFICAGRQTRSQRSFDLQFEMMQAGQASLMVMEYDNNQVGFLFTAMFQKTAVLCSTANLPNYEDRVPIYKLLILNTFYYLKDQRYDWVQFGQPANRSLVSGFDNYCDEKQLRISKYKRGYNPLEVPHFRGIKYYDKPTFSDDLKVFETKVLEVIKK